MSVCRKMDTGVVMGVAAACRAVWGRGQPVTHLCAVQPGLCINKVMYSTKQEGEKVNRSARIT